MYTLCIANKNYSSWSLRPWVLMRALDIDFAEQLLPFEAGSNYQRFRRFAPNGKVPCLLDAGVAIWDSLAITEYLAERHAGVWPQDPAARAWARCAAAEMHAGFSALRDRCSMSCGVRVRLRETPPDLQQDLARIEELWNEGLQRFGGPFLAGAAFTAVDAFYAPVAFRIQTYGLALAGRAAAYVPQLLGQAPMRQWYDEALRETWRDEAHEAHTRLMGETLHDYRAA